MQGKSNDRITKDQDHDKRRTCAECNQDVTDMRGLTSHARHKHGIGRDELVAILGDDNDSDNGFLKTVGGIGAVFLAIITLGRLR